ncbi:MAG: hypothetical protein A2579_00055 [Lysobacterales bacterium RIFOXYD1_FULL_69_11]|nr:MAG: hypothetical protein A2579_00055 [Xanthomonadales bacterium RIFOXYD1_FULL_69_11]
MWLRMPTAITAGVSSMRGVTASIARSAALMKPVCSATPRPSIATSTTPKGAKLTNVCTIVAMKAVRLAPLSRLTICTGSPLRGSISPKLTLASSADSAQVASMRIRNSTAGSGSLLPTRSTPSRKRVTMPRFSGALGGTEGVGVGWDMRRSGRIEVARILAREARGSADRTFVPDRTLTSFPRRREPRDSAIETGTKSLGPRLRGDDGFRKRAGPWQERAGLLPTVSAPHTRAPARWSCAPRTAPGRTSAPAPA